MDLSGKNIIITGASSGIGRTCALVLNKLGAKVHLVARNEERLNEVASKLKEDSFSINIMNIANFDRVEQIIQSIVNEHGRINGFIHSAGIQRIQPFRSQNFAHFLDVFSVNTFSAFEITRLITQKKYAEPKGMSIVFISSVMSVAADVGIASYCASKTALVGGARALALELASKGIRINCVSPATIANTGMTIGVTDGINEDEFQKIVDKHPSGLGSTNDVAQLCAFLLSDNAKWITGQNIVIDGGYSVR